MSELKTNLEAILQEKQRKILPENIKKDVQIFDVIGTLDATGTTINNQDKTITENGQYTADEGYTGLGTVTVNIPGGDTKTFETEEDMLADENPVPNGKALIYRRVETQIEPNTSFKDIYLPETITMPKTVTSETVVEVQTMSEHGGGGGNITISPTGFSMMFNMNMNMADVSYTSEDGITYKRGSVTVDNMMTEMDYWEFTDDILSINDGTYGSEGYYMIYNFVSGDLDICKAIFKRNSYGYYGLFINKGEPNTDLVEWNTNIRLNATGEDYNDWTVEYDKGETDSIPDNLEKVASLMYSSTFKTYHNLVEKISDTLYRVYLYKGSSTSSSYSAGCFVVVKDYTGESNNDNIYIGGYGSSTTLVICEVDTAAGTVKDITSDYTFVDYPSSTQGRSSAKTIAAPINRFGQFSYFGKSQRNLDIVVVHASDTGVNFPWRIDCSPGKSYSYVPAQTQFTLNNKNQLLPGVVALGYDGEYTGDNSIYDAISYNDYMLGNNINLIEGTVYFGTDTYTGIANAKAKDCESALKYIQCTKINQVFENAYLVIKSSVYNVWFNPGNKTLFICDTNNSVLSEYSNTNFKDLETFSHNVVNNDLYMYASAGLLFKYDSVSNEVTVLKTFDYYDDNLLFTDNCMYATVKSSNTVMNVDKILYDGTTNTITSWTRQDGDYSGDAQLLVKDNILFVTMNVINDNYGFFSMIDLTNDNVIISKSYSLQGCIATNIDTNEFIFCQVANTGTDLYNIGEDGTLTKFGHIDASIYNSSFNYGYYIPSINDICAFNCDRSYVYIMANSKSTFTSSFLLNNLISGSYNRIDNADAMSLTNVTYNNGVMTAECIHYNADENLNYICNIYVDTNCTFTTDSNNLLTIDNEKIVNNISRTVEILVPPIKAMSYEGTISPEDYNTAINTAKQIEGSVE